jgi:hypothetical protein
VFQLLTSKNKKKMAYEGELKKKIVHRLSESVTFDPVICSLFAQTEMFADIALLLKANFIKYCHENIIQPSDFTEFGDILTAYGILLNFNNVKDSYVIINKGGRYVINGVSLVMNYAKDAFIEVHDQTRIETWGGVVTGYDETFSDGFGDSILRIQPGARGIANGDSIMIGRDATLSSFGNSITVAFGNSTLYEHSKDAFVFAGDPNVEIVKDE